MVEIRVNEKSRKIYHYLSDYLSKSFHLSMELGYLGKLTMKLIFNPKFSEKISLTLEFRIYSRHLPALDT